MSSVLDGCCLCPFVSEELDLISHNLGEACGGLPEESVVLVPI